MYWGRERQFAGSHFCQSSLGPFWRRARCLASAALIFFLERERERERRKFGRKKLDIVGGGKRGKMETSLRRASPSLFPLTCQAQNRQEQSKEEISHRNRRGSSPYSSLSPPSISSVLDQFICRSERRERARKMICSSFFVLLPLLLLYFFQKQIRVSFTAGATHQHTRRRTRRVAGRGKQKNY